MYFYISSSCRYTYRRTFYSIAFLENYDNESNQRYVNKCLFHLSDTKAYCEYFFHFFREQFDIQE